MEKDEKLRQWLGVLQRVLNVFYEAFKDRGNE
jgi:hypothetical protein